MTNGGGALLIRQTAPRPKLVFVSVQNNLINQWDLRLGDAPMNFEIRLDSGDHTVEFADSLPTRLDVNVNAGMGNLGLISAPGLAAQVILGEKSNPEVKSYGDWTQNGSIYETGSGSAALTITVNIRGGELNLDNK